MSCRTRWKRSRAPSRSPAHAGGVENKKHMSLYNVQKLMFQLNRDPAVRRRFDTEFESLLADYDLTAEEQVALRDADIGLLYVMGVNGQILMHYAALRGFE